MNEHNLIPGGNHNPTGITNVVLGKTTRELKKILRDKFFEQCDIHGYEHLTWGQLAVDSLFRKAAAGDLKALKFITDRVWGRAPLNIHVSQQDEPDLSSLTDEQLAERMEKSAQEMRRALEASTTDEEQKESCEK